MKGASEAAAPRGGPRERAPGMLGVLQGALAILNAAIVRAGAVALVAAAFVLTYSVVTRYFFKMATDWQDEAAVFCIVGAVFLSAAYVQSYRGHIGIELLPSLLGPRAERVRQLAVDIVSWAFCAFFAWKSWALWHEAWRDNQTTTSAWAPPLWIPYGLMSAGMTLLAVQLALQVAVGLLSKGRK